MLYLLKDWINPNQNFSTLHFIIVDLNIIKWCVPLLNSKCQKSKLHTSTVFCKYNKKTISIYIAHFNKRLYSKVLWNEETVVSLIFLNFRPELYTEAGVFISSQIRLCTDVVFVFCFVSTFSINVKSVCITHKVKSF